MNRKAKNGIKVLISLVIAIAMIGIPASIFTGASNDDWRGRLQPVGWTGGHEVTHTDATPMDWVWVDEEFDTFPGGWLVYDFYVILPYIYLSPGGGAWAQASPGSNLPGADPANCASHTGSAYVLDVDYFVSPPITIDPSLTSANIGFDYMGYVGTGDMVYVYISSDGYDGSSDNCADLWTGTGAHTTFVGFYGNAAAWTPASIPVGAYAGQTIHLFYEVWFPLGGDTISIDNVNLLQVAEHDVDVSALVKPDPEERHNTAPTEIWVDVTNRGEHTETNIDLHLQIYEEIVYQPEIDWYDDMESCCVNWSAHDWDGDGLTWERTDRRYNSPTHSWRVTGCNRATYAGNSHDSLISKPIKIPKWEAKAWLNFSLWVQGEVNYVDAGLYKFEDYLQLSISVLNETTGNWSDWTTIDKYADTGGEWTYPELMEDGTERLNVFGADYDHWNCTKGSGAPWKWWGGIDLDPYTDGDPAGKTVRFNFTWISDPAHQFEGAYIDDVRILSGRGPEQPLVYQGYKFLHELDAGETKLVAFPLDYTFKDHTWYFIEVYSNLENDTDGPGEVNYVVTQKYLPGQQDPVTYRIPWNGVNESVWFGDVHDGAVLDVTAPDKMELYYGQCEDVACVDVPIEVTVYNNGTLEEDIPVQVVAREKIMETIFWDDFEDGTMDKWQGVYFTGDNADDFYWDVLDWDPHTGNYHAFAGDARGFLHPHMCQGIFSIIDPDTEEGFQLTGNELAVYFTYWAQWKMDGEGWTNFNTGTRIWDAVDNFDAWAPVLEDPVQNAGLGSYPSGTLGYLISGHSNDQYYGPTSPGPYINPNDPSPYSENLFKIDVIPWMEYYSGLGYDNYRFGWVVSTDESGMPDLTFPGDVWSGLKIDDVYVNVEIPGPIVWESEIQYVHLEPGQSKVVDFTWHACEYSFYIIEGRTLLEGDCNPDNDKEISDVIYLYSTIYDDDIENDQYIEDNWETEDNTFGKSVYGGHWEIVDNGACDWNLDHYWYSGTVIDSNTVYINVDDTLWMVNETDGKLGGPNDDGAFNLTGYDNAQLEFDHWYQFEYDYWYDYGLLEVSNDSGQDWWILDFWSESSNYLENEEDWSHYSIELFNATAGHPNILAFADWYDWAMFYYWNGTALNFSAIQYPLDWAYATNITPSDSMHFRFHFLSNGAWVEKGWYIDDVYLNTSKNVTIPWNGVDRNWTWEHTVLFHDDMEDADVSARKWMAMDQPAGQKWHVTEHCYNSPTHSWWCAHEGTYSNYNIHLDEYGFPVADSSPMNYYNNMENNLTLTVDLSDKYQAYLYYYENFTFADENDYGLLKVSTDGGQTWRTLGGTAGLTSGGWIQKKVDLSLLLPAVVMIRWEFISNETGTDEGWQIDDILIEGKPDCQEPVTTCILNPPTPDGNNGWYVSSVEVTLTATDNKEVSTIYYSIDGGVWLEYTAPFTINVDGEHTISYYAVDHVGNAEEPKSCSFKIDTTAPTGSISTPQAGYIYLFGRELMPRIFNKGSALIIGGLTATATASDATSGVDYVKFSTGAGSGEDAVAPYEFNLPFYFPFGSDTLTVSVTDNAGNTGTDGSVAYTKIL